MAKNNTKSLFSYQGHNYLVPFLLVSSLFFMWGFAHGILEVLNPHFQESFHISKAMSAFVQAAVYGAYFLMAIPAGIIIRKFGYRAGVITGLCFFGMGALLFIPGSQLNSFPFFVFSLFVIGCGLTCLETSANPYTTVLGDPDKAESRINLSQSLNGLGWIFGPLIGGQLLFSGISISVPYTIVGIIVLCVALVFCKIKLPEVSRQEEESLADLEDKEDLEVLDNPESLGKIETHRLWNVGFILAVVALFLYVAAQTGVNSFFINYMTENADISKTTASNWLAFGGMGLFVVGRLSGSWMMNKFDARRLLMLYAILATVATAFIVTCSGAITLAAFFVVYFCESIMFPTIFSLGIRYSQGNTKRASSILIMTIVGGAVAPVIMGYIADTTGSMPMAFIIPLLCYIFIAGFALVKK